MTIIDRRYSVAEGQAIKTPCKAATTANITLGGLQTIDGIALAENDRVLVKNQSTGSQNGIYAASTGNWTRTRDFDGAYDVVTGTAVYIAGGTVSARHTYLVTAADPITIDTTSIAFEQDKSSEAIAAAAAALASQVAAASSASSASSSASSASTSASTATAAAALIAPIVPSPQGYLTLTSGLPVIASDVTAGTAVYYTPFVGNAVPIYNGALFVPTVFTELTLAMNAAHAASNIYDVFVFSNSGVVTIVTGPTWSAGTAGSITAGSCARGTGAGGAALSRVSGIYTNAVQITGRNGATTYTIAANLATYVGSIFMDGTNGQITCHRSYGQSRKWGVWNAYNREPISLQTGDATGSWSPASSSFSSTNSSANNSATVFCGLPEESVFSQYQQNGTASYSSNTASGNVGIGLNVTNGASGTQGSLTMGNATTAGSAAGNMIATYTLLPTIGINKLNMVEQRSNTFTNSGGAVNCLMTNTWRG